MKQRWYHATADRLRVGTYLSGSVTPRGWVFLTNQPNPHHTIYEEAVLQGWNVYEVVPVTSLRFGNIWDEAQCRQVKIVGYVGNARGIGPNSHRQWQNKGRIVGSSVKPCGRLVK